MYMDYPNFDYCFKCKVSWEDAHPGHRFVEKPTQTDRMERSKRCYLESMESGKEGKGEERWIIVLPKKTESTVFLAGKKLTYLCKA